MFGRSVVVLGDDSGLLREATSELSRVGFRVSTSTSEIDSADVVLRDWRDRKWTTDVDVPVVSVDLSVIQGRGLVHVVERVLGRPASRLATYLALLTLLHGHLPEA